MQNFKHLKAVQRIAVSRNSSLEGRSEMGGRKRTKKVGKRRGERTEYEEDQ
jgi:hypothetical protein